MPNYSPEVIEEVAPAGQLIPEGTLVECVYLFDKEARQSKPNKDGGSNSFYNVTLEVVSGKYLGSRFYDNIAVSGSEGYFLQRGQTFIQYALEWARQAHQNGNYMLDNVHELNGKRIGVLVGVKPHTMKDGKQIHVNEAKAYFSPRESSSSHKYYEAWVKGEQPYQTAELPPLTQSNAYNGQSNSSFDHATQDIPL